MGLQSPRGHLLEKNLCGTFLTRMFTSSASCRNLSSLSCTSLALTNSQEWCLTELTPWCWILSKEETTYAGCDDRWTETVNLQEQTVQREKGQCLATLDCDSWVKRERWCVRMCARVHRLIKWNQNEKWVKWPRNEKPNFFSFSIVV